MQQVIELNPVEPARIGWRQARGAAFSGDFYFRTPEAVALNTLDQSYPQLVFRPRSDTGVSAYDLTVTDPAGGGAHLDVPGAFFSDPRGYSLEMYFRDSQGVPQAMVAAGTVAMTGGAYQYEGPLFSATLPTGPVGPQGPTGKAGADSTVPGPSGPAGQRGSMWFTGVGPPPGGTTDYVTGDMWLDQSNGDTWRFDSSLGAWARQ